MPVITAATSTLLIIDFQARLMPAIDDAAHAVRNAKRLLDAANLLNIPSVLTEQNPKGLGGTVAVSYTHLDVYKRQRRDRACIARMPQCRRRKNSQQW